MFKAMQEALNGQRSKHEAAEMLFISYHRRRTRPEGDETCAFCTALTIRSTSFHNTATFHSVEATSLPVTDPGEG